MLFAKIYFMSIVIFLVQLLSGCYFNTPSKNHQEYIERMKPEIESFINMIKTRKISYVNSDIKVVHNRIMSDPNKNIGKIAIEKLKPAIISYLKENNLWTDKSNGLWMEIGRYMNYGWDRPSYWFFLFYDTELKVTTSIVLDRGRLFYKEDSYVGLLIQDNLLENCFKKIEKVINLTQNP